MGREPVRVAVSGAGGAIGTALCRKLRGAGHTVVTLVRDAAPAGEGSFFWDPAAGVIDEDVWRGTDAVVHLAGANLFSRRWTQSFKKQIRESRLAGTALLARSMIGAEDRPATLISASAIGFYGSESRALPAVEESPRGNGFLADLCGAWEEEAGAARKCGVRVVQLRIGLVLEVLLRKMLFPFRLGIGGRLGDGKQVMSWIAMDDLVRSVLFILDDPDLDGPVNAVAPGAVTNSEFTKTIGGALRRPAILPAPASLLRLLLGREMADETVLSDIHAIPAKLSASRFEFQSPRLADAVRSALR